MAEMDPVGGIVAANPFAIGDPAKIPAKRYYDPEFYRLECEKLWPHVWQMACRLEQIPNVGDWVEYSNVGKSVIVVRAKDGVRAFHNHCRHRGVPIAGGTGNEHGNCATKGFICPFHGWRWNMEGECTFVYGRHLFDEKLLNKDEIALRACRVETWSGCAFINFDDDAPSFRESMGSILPAFEARKMDKLRAEWWFATVLPANWKIAMEAFMEGYHVMKTHPQLQQAVPMLYNTRYGNDTGGLGPQINPNISLEENIAAQVKNLELLNSGMSGLVHAKEVEIARGVSGEGLSADPQAAIMQWFGLVNAAITAKLREAGEDAPDLNQVMVEHPLEAVSYLFPHYFLLTMFTSMSSYRIRPLGPESCLFEIWSLTQFPEGQDPQPPMEPTVLPYDSKDFPLIPQQDYSNIPIQQKGMHSEGFDYMRLAANVEGLVSNYQQLIDGYIAGAAPERLAAACATLGASFDGKIADFGF
jgi:carnitine monooxygenase subunit